MTLTGQKQRAQLVALICFPALFQWRSKNTLIYNDHKPPSLPDRGIFIHCPFGTPDGTQSRTPAKTCLTSNIQDFKVNIYWYLQPQINKLSFSRLL